MSQSNIEAKTAASERRMTMRLLAYWEELRGSRAMPRENDIDPDDIEELWDHCFLLQVRDLQKPEGGNFTYVGKVIVDTYRAGYTGDACGGLVSLDVRALGQNFAEVVKKATPQMNEGEFKNVRGRVVKYRQCLLPLATNGTAVDAIFGCMALKAV